MNFSPNNDSPTKEISANRFLTRNSPLKRAHSGDEYFADRTTITTRAHTTSTHNHIHTTPNPNSNPNSNHNHNHTTHTATQNLTLDFEEQMELSDKTIHFYNRLSPYYDRGYRSYLSHTHDKFIEMLGETHPEDRILDLSAGTGILAERLIQERKPFAHLTVNDPSLGMLNSAMTKLPSRSDLTYTQHKAEELPFHQGQFDIICSLNSFHYYTDQEAVLRNVSQLLSPGGRFLLLDWNLQGFFRIPNRIIKTFSPEYIDTKPVTYHEEMLPRHGFSIRHCETWTRRYWNFYRVDARKRLG